MGMIKLVFLILLVAAAAMAEVEAHQFLEGCPQKCGDIEIPYPFGVGQQPGTGHNCFLEETFKVTCDKSTSKLLYRDNIQISNISPQVSQMEILINVSKVCQNVSGMAIAPEQSLRNDDYFTISNKQNKFVTIGCDTLSLFATSNSFRNDSYTSGCVTLCDKPPPQESNDKNCSGTGCCQVDIPAGMNSINFSVSIVNLTNVLSFNNCSYAFVAKHDWFKFSPDYLDYFPNETAPLVLDWSVSNPTCQKGSSSRDDHCACSKNNTDLFRSNNDGYNCKCKTGFEGNPYHPDGCQDVNECNQPNNNCSISRHALCHNFDGGYSCSCPPGYKGDGYVIGTHCTRSQPHLLILIISLSSVVFLLVVFTLVSTSCWVHKQRTLKQIRQRNFEQNGGNLLQQQSYTERTKIYTEIELKNATNNFDSSRILGRGGQGTVYKGMLPDNTHVAIKKSRVGGDPRQIKDFINEVFVLSQINHRNVVKILGCCLETEVPLLVYEFVDNGTLFDHIDSLKNGRSIAWETRLTIAAETSEAISYLHSAASIPIIHRDIKSANILLDHNDRAKISDFGASRLVPIDETQVTTVVQGTLGYLDPEYLHTGQLNEKSDVYSFGVVLVELLTGNKAVEFNNRPELRNLAMYFVSSMKENRLWEILDRRLDKKKNAKQLEDVALLASRCLRVNGEERPTIKEVALELQNIMIAMEIHPCVKDKAMNEEESEYLLGHIPNGYGDGDASASISIVPSNHDSIQKQIAFGISDGR